MFGRRTASRVWQKSFLDPAGHRYAGDGWLYLFVHFQTGGEHHQAAGTTAMINLYKHDRLAGLTARSIYPRLKETLA